MYQVNFLPWRHQQILRKKRRFLMLLLIQSCAVIMVIVYLTCYHQTQYQQLQFNKVQLQQQFIQTQQLVGAITKKQARLNGLIAQQQRLDKQIESNNALLHFFHQLPEITPKKSWLAGFSLKDNRVEINANSYDFQDISQLIIQLESSQLLDQIQLIKMGKIKQVNYLHLSANYPGSRNE